MTTDPKTPSEDDRIVQRQANILELWQASVEYDRLHPNTTLLIPTEEQPNE